MVPVRVFISDVQTFSLDTVTLTTPFLSYCGPKKKIYFPWLCKSNNGGDEKNNFRVKMGNK